MTKSVSGQSKSLSGLGEKLVCQGTQIRIKTEADQIDKHFLPFIIIRYQISESGVNIICDYDNGIDNHGIQITFEKK